MLKILGRASSINVMKVLWVCDELKLPYERVDVGGAFAFKNQPDYLDLNPNGRVPTINDDGFILWESNVIVRYLSAKHGMGKLFPTDDRTRWNAERWMDWQQTTVSPAMTPMFWGLVRTAPEQRDAAAIENSRKATAEAMNILDKHLAKSPFVAGKSFTMADIPLGCMAYRWLAFPVERPQQPHLVAWHEQLKQRPGYRKHLTLPMT
jgi:glutathione S-transferase